MSLPPPPTVDSASRQVFQLPTGDHRLDDIQSLRYRVYIGEQKKRLSAADHVRRRLGDRLDLSATHFVAVQNHVVIAAGRINTFPIDHPIATRAGLAVLGNLGVERVAYVSKLVLSPDCRTGTTLAARMMVAMIRWGVEKGLEVGFCHCNGGLVAMYERLGLLRLERPWLDPELGPQVLMTVFADMTESLSRFSRDGSLKVPGEAMRATCTAARRLLGHINSPETRTLVN